MSLRIPDPIAKYFDADANGNAVAQCFTPEAVVVDEKQTHVGRDEIAAWKAQASSKYQYTSTPVAIEEKAGRLIVTAHVVGNFPGSPTDLRYTFTLAGDEIDRLEIVP